MKGPSSVRPRQLRRVVAALAWAAASLAAVATAVLLVWKRRPVVHQHDELSGRGTPSTPPSRTAVTLGHETRDMSGRAMMWLTIGLGSSVALVIGLMLVLVDVFQHERRHDERSLTGLQTLTVLPPAPNLQRDPVGDLARMHAGEDRLLHGYAWIDRGHARARIPIQRAMTLAIGHTLEPMP